MLEGLHERSRRRVLERLEQGDALAWCPACAKVGPADSRCSACGTPTELITVERARPKRD